jgi:hypothetical protein
MGCTSRTKLNGPGWKESSSAVLIVEEEKHPPIQSNNVCRATLTAVVRNFVVFSEASAMDKAVERAKLRAPRAIRFVAAKLRCLVVGNAKDG